MSGTEGIVAQVMATGGTITGFRCYQSVTAAASRTFTLKKGTISGATVTFTATTWTCAIASGARSGTGTNSGGTVTYSAGDTLDVALPAPVDAGANSAAFAVAVGP
jgi:hypothetical protein